MKKDFDVIDHTADIGIIAYGTDLKQAFANAARGMFSLITELESIKEKELKIVEVKSPDREALLVNWLNELIYLFEVKRMLFSRFDMHSLTDNELKAAAYGERINLKRHHLKIQVKAATYHTLKISEEADGWEARVIFDI